ncbi:MAG: cation:proton antiporter [Myxococcota bacterium]|nr:cation:proton antiporter [Myxococcota bacterium]
MQDAHEFLRTLAVVLGVAAVTTVVFQRLRQPVVLGYLLAGMIVGPHVPGPLHVHAPTVRILSELGVILLMFTLGLEFSLRKLAKVGGSSSLIAALECSLMVWLGFLVGRAFGWTTREAIFTGAIVAISSTTIVVKAFSERGITGRLAQTVFGILIAEDLIAILLMTGLTAVSAGGAFTLQTAAGTAGRLTAFLATVIVLGLFVVPRLFRFVVRLNRVETTLVASVGLCFVVALMAQAAGYSVALGAFLAGSLIGESGEEKRVEALVLPVRDLFAAIFFVSVGMLIDPLVIATYWAPILALTGVVIAGKILGVSLGTFLTGGGTRRSLQAGMSLAQIGEFSFIIAGVGLATGGTRSFLYAVAVAVSALTILVSPWLIRVSEPVSAAVERHLPHTLQTFAALYGSWLDRLSSSPREQSRWRPMRRRIWFLVVDALALVLVAIAGSTYVQQIVEFVTAQTTIPHSLARLAVVGAGGLLSLPFLIGFVRSAQYLGRALAAQALPLSGNGKVDLSAAPRRMLVVTVQLMIVLVIGIPLLAVTQPFLPLAVSAPVMLAVLIVLGISFYRSATNLQGHVRAGAQVVLEALNSQLNLSHDDDAEALQRIAPLLPGLGEPIPFRVVEGNFADGRTLAALNLRGLTGVTVVAVARAGGGVAVPTADDVLRAGDVLALAGSTDSVLAARELLGTGRGRTGRVTHPEMQAIVLRDPP